MWHGIKLFFSLTPMRILFIDRLDCERRWLSLEVVVLLILLLPSLSPNSTATVREVLAISFRGVLQASPLQSMGSRSISDARTYE